VRISHCTLGDKLYLTVHYYGRKQRYQKTWRRSTTRRNIRDIRNSSTYAISRTDSPARINASQVNKKSRELEDSKATA
jgi:hypothetical protein